MGELARRIWRRGSGSRLAPPILIVAAVLLWTWRLALIQLGMVGLDAFTYFYPYAAYGAEALRSGRLPLWNPEIFLGVPFLANLQAGLFYPPNLLRLLVPAYRAAAWLFAAHLILAGAGTYLFSRRALGMSRFGGVVAGLAIAGSGALGAQAEHPNQVSALAWLPWLLVLVKESSERRGVYPFVAAGAVALVLFAGHAQSAFIVLTAGMAYVAYLPFTQGTQGAVSLRRVAGGLALYAGTVGLGMGLAAIQLAPAWELAGLSLRSGGLETRQALSFSLPPQFLLVSLLPAFADSPFSEYIAYIGVAGGVLALLALSRSPKRRAVRLGLGMSALGLFLGLGLFNPFYVVLVEIVPGFGLFRAPARWIFLTSFGLAVLAGLGADAWLAGEWKGIRLRTAMLGRRPVAWALGTLSFAALIWFGPTVSPATWTAWILVTGATLGILIWGHAGRRAWAGALLALLVIAELFAAGRYLPHAQVTAPEAYTSLRTTTTHLLSDGGLFRVISISDTEFDPGDLEDLQVIFGESLPEAAISNFIVATKWKEILAPNLSMVYGISTADGYDGGILPLARYLDLARLLHNQQGEPLADGRLYQTLKEAPPPHLLDLLNVKYLILDKVRDRWIDDVFYDLGLRARVVAGVPLEVLVPDSPSLRATHLGLIFAPGDGPPAEEGRILAQLRLEDGSGGRTLHSLLAPSPGSGAREIGELDGPGGPIFYHTVVPLSRPGWPAKIVVSATGAGTSLQIAGMSLIDGRSGGHLPVAVSQTGRLRLDHSGDVKIYENLGVLPRAFLVGDVEVVEDDAAVLQILSDPRFAADRIVVASDPLPPVSAVQGGGRVEVISYAPERIEVRAESPNGGYLVVTDAFYPGWVAEVDGAAVPIYRVDFYFRGIWLKPGPHTVVMRFEPTSFRLGAAASGVALLAALAGALRGWIGGRRTGRVAIIRVRDA